MAVDDDWPAVRNAPASTTRSEPSRSNAQVVNRPTQASPARTAVVHKLHSTYDDDEDLVSDIDPRTTREPAAVDAP